MVETGRILRFDEVRGYGFISPVHGGEDVFMHVNDFLEDKSRYTPGSLVEFVVEEGDRGLKACEVQVVQYAAPAAGAVPVSGPVSGPVPAAGASGGTAPDGASSTSKVSAYQLGRDLTDLLLEADPTLTGAQILRLRRKLVEFAGERKWIEA